MALLKKPPALVERKAITIRMPEPVVAGLHHYAEFLGSTLDHVVVQALQFVFNKGLQFKKWLEQYRGSDRQSSVRQANENRPLPAEAVEPLTAKRDVNRTTGGQTENAETSPSSLSVAKI